ncbi:N-acetylneuraminate lyase [Patella vulgata]|uniref:N-acetylneuraminate lyase n=1 Tax=Patella vulgata TaxID=6465 RepID=UPI00217FEF79|nr:N-acetylneuraminate lyase [Patella vulgata]
MVNGTTGEGISMTIEERKLVVEEWVKVAKSRMLIVVHVGCACLRDSQELNVVDRHGNKYSVLFGNDDEFLGALVHGIEGAVGSTYNFMAAVFHRLIKALEEGNIDVARIEQGRSRDVIVIFLEYVKYTYGSVGAQKEIMSLIGLDLGPPRCPMRRLPPEKLTEMKQRLSDIGFFNYIK